MTTVAHFCSTFLKPDMQHLYRQITGLQDAGDFENVVITRSRENEDPFWYWEKKVRVIRKHPLRLFRRIWHRNLNGRPSVPLSFRESRDILYELRRTEAELLHVYFGHVAVELLPVLRCVPIPFVVSFHGADAGVHVDDGEIRKLREVFQRAVKVMARSEALLDDLKQLGCPVHKLCLLRTGIPLDGWEWKRRTMPSDGAWQVIQACRMVEKKGLHTTLKAFAQVRLRFPNAKLVLAGDGPLQSELQGLVKKMGLQEAVRFPGFLSQDELRNCMEQSHLFVHPSQTAADGNREGVPNSMLEAMACGLPVVATRHGGIPEAVEHGVTGRLADEKNATAIANLMEEYFKHPERLADEGEAARLSIEAEFSQKSQVAQAVTLYREILAERRPNRV